MLKKILFFILSGAVLLALLTACGNGTTTTTSATQTPTTTTQATTTPVTPPPTTTAPTTTPSTTTPAVNINANANVAIKMVGLLYELEAVQKYYDDGAMAMATFQVKTTKSKNGMRAMGSIDNIPQEFKDKLPPGGAIPAPAGACPAAAQPEVTFVTEDGEEVTPELLIEKALETVPAEYVTAAQDEANSLLAIIEDMVQMGDTRLATAEGWNELLWDKLGDLREPAESLWDYQLWNAASEIETQIADLYYERLKASGAPQIVLNAFKNSNQHGWFANQEATPGDALARMEIVAEMTGSISGTVYEHRDFSIPGAGQPPEYGPQTGEGIVTSNIPEVGDVEFSVDINLTEFDEQGRAIGGTVVADAIDYEGYQVIFTFKPDGSKDGVVLKDGEELGYLTMTVDHSKFENYVDIKSGTEMKIPEEIRPKF